MPENIKIGSFVLGAILVLIAILGGNFKLFGAEVAASVSNRWLRLASFALGIAFVASAMYPFGLGDGTSPPKSPTPWQEEDGTPTPPVGELLQALEEANIDFSVPRMRNELGNRYSSYPQFATGCLGVLGKRRFKNRVDFLVMISDYQDLEGKVDPDSGDGNLDEGILKKAMLKAYNVRNGSDASQFESIVESKP